MTDDFASLFAYDRWANGLVLDACRALTPEQYAAEPVPGWASIRSTLAHLAIATGGWLRVLSGEEVTEFPTEADLPTVDDAARLLERAYAIVDTLLPTLTPEALATPRTYRGGGRAATLPPWAGLRHLVNHGTYHRGQIAAKLKRLGVEPPATDLIFWVFGQIPQPS